MSDCKSEPTRRVHNRSKEEQQKVQEHYDKFLIEAIVASTHREHSPVTQNLINERNKEACEMHKTDGKKLCSRPRIHDREYESRQTPEQCDKGTDDQRL